MQTDRKVLYTISLSSLAVLFLAWIFPNEISGRIVAAIFLLPLAGITCFFVKKRSALSINRRQVLLLMAVIGLLYVVLYYVTGLHFRFYRTGYRFDLDGIVRFILPITVIVVATELIRSVIRAQNSKLADALTYLSCVVAEVLICSHIGGIHSFNKFMDVVGLSFFPAIVSNLLYHYLSKRYGAYPNIVYRLFITLYTYIIPFKPAMPDSLFAFVNLIIPLIIYLFIDALYESKRRYAMGKRSKFSTVITAVAVVVMASVVMLISNQFRFGMLVIATDSMTGELNKGDAAIYERYDDQIIAVGQVIAFEKDSSVVVHRVIDIKNVDGTNRYYTQGDVNEEPDSGYVTESQVVGLVNLKVPYIGYPTIWLRSLFSR